MPVWPLVMVIQEEAGLTTLHEHVAVVETVTEPFPAAAVHDALDGLMVNTQAPAWVIVNEWPAIESVVLRELGDVLAAMEYVTVPSPVSLAPPVMVTHVAGLVAVHAHPAGAETATEPVEAPEVIDEPVGLMDVLQVAVNWNGLDTVLRPN